MKLFALIHINADPYLRQKNPLEGQLIISEKAYLEHEKLYHACALPFPDAPKGRLVFTEGEVTTQWQFRERNNLPWQNVTEPAFVGTEPSQYRQIYRLIVTESFQDRVRQWVIDCFGPEHATNIEERALRYLEESLELVQSLGLPKERALKQLVWTFGRPEGEAKQEFGGVGVTLAALAAAVGVDIRELAEVQINENIANSDKIKAKHQLKIKQGIAL